MGMFSRWLAGNGSRTQFSLFYVVSTSWLPSCEPLCWEMNIEPSCLPNRTCNSIQGFKHGFSCINIRQVPWEVLKTEAEGTWRMLMHWKTMFDRYYCIKTGNICYFSRYFLHYFVSPFHRCRANAICTNYARSGAGQYTSRDAVAPVRAYWKLRSRALTARELPC